MRTKQQILALTGHKQTVTDLKCQEADPQIITASSDSTIKLWDLAAGKTMTTLTHHKKSVRALALNPNSFSFASASPDNIKQWKCPNGDFIQNLVGHRTIINTMACNQDGVLFSGGGCITTFHAPIFTADQYHQAITDQCISGITKPDTISKPLRLWCNRDHWKVKLVSSAPHLTSRDPD